MTRADAQGAVMDNRSLVGRCGLYCGACGIYRAQRDDQEWRKRIAEHFDCPAEKVRCDGCGALTPDCWGWDCKLVLCLNNRGHQFCNECPDYEQHTCEKFEKLAKRYLEEDGVDLRKNLAMIEEGRVDEWLADSKRLYACRHCGKPVTTGAKRCHHCGLEIDLSSGDPADTDENC
ncbi:hypothetical protein AMJ39_04545 [candidate division TA06 bacterium DG_24]|nr:MAG: hypothetical protein AMJ39_04545 [candidate division TA06 bacterium DG_24]KPK68637.1 MAG: hypothetical protein AMJ82_07760 [candidate division TA06 bacterium SM23_40]